MPRPTHRRRHAGDAGRSLRSCSGHTQERQPEACARRRGHAPDAGWSMGAVEHRESSQPGQRAGGVLEAIRLDAHFLCEGEEDVGERGMFVRVVGEVGAVFEAEF